MFGCAACDFVFRACAASAGGPGPLSAHDRLDTEHGADLARPVEPDKSRLFAEPESTGGARIAGSPGRSAPGWRPRRAAPCRNSRASRYTSPPNGRAGSGTPLAEQRTDLLHQPALELRVDSRRATRADVCAAGMRSPMGTDLAEVEGRERVSKVRGQRPAGQRNRPRVPGPGGRDRAARMRAPDAGSTRRTIRRSEATPRRSATRSRLARSARSAPGPGNSPRVSAR